MKKEQVYVINEIGDMGLGCTELSKEEQEAIKEQEQKESK